MTKFDRKWAQKKVDLKRRQKELTDYISLYLPELKSMDPGLVVDIGCGPCDFLSMCQSLGHEAVGIDAECGEGGMGDAYLEVCKEYCEEFQVNVWRCGLQEVMMNRDDYELQDVSVINARGSIEQCFSSMMSGDPHDIHHNARKLDWIQGVALPWFDYFFAFCSGVLVDGGILMIAANGTRSTDDWYANTVKECAKNHGLRLMIERGKLTHKWRKA